MIKCDARSKKYLLNVLILSVFFDSFGSVALTNKLDPKISIKKTNVEKKDKTKKHSDQQVLTAQDIRALQMKFKSFNHLEVKFFQNTYRSLRKKNTPSEGEAFFTKPNKFVWVIKKPRESQWKFDGKELNYFEEKTKKIVSYPADATKGRELRQIVDMVMNFDTLLKNFDLKSAKKVNDVVNISLTPKLKSEIKKAVVEIETKSNFMRSLLLEFDHGNYSKIDFKFMSDKPIPESKYTIKKG